MSIDVRDKIITVSQDIFMHLPPDVKISALILRKLGRLVIVPSETPAGAIQ